MIGQKLEFLTSVPATVISGIFLGASLALLFAGQKTVFNPALATLAISGTPLACTAAERLFRDHVISSDLLVTIAMASCVALGEYFAAGEIAFIMTIGEKLEEMTIARARKGLHKLLSLEPETCLVIRDGAEFEIPVKSVVRGDRIRIRPGEIIPVDGEVVSGETAVDQSSMTGESLPVDKNPGDPVMSGTLNCFGSIEIQTLKTGEDSSIQKLIRIVRDAENKKAPAQRIVDQWAAWMVPAAVVIAVATCILTRDVIRGVAILVVFCPCALVLATPAAIMAAIGQAAKSGVIVKSGEALEKMGRVDRIALDKTGTLTCGRLEVSDLISMSDIPEKELLRLAAAAEIHSGHPLGKATVEYAKKQGIRSSVPDSFSMSSGKGVSVRFEGKEILCGNSAFLREYGIAASAETEKKMAALRKCGKALAEIACDGKPAGIIAFSDILRPEAAQTISELKLLGVETVLLTGDHAGAAEYFARESGIETVCSGLLPEQKKTAVEILQKQGRTVCMIGDGVNDAPALKTAEVGIAMGAAGSDIAVESADIALIRDDLTKIPWLKKLSNAAIRSIKINIALSMGINCTAVILSILGIMGPVSGALIHNAGSVLVILNAALLYDRKI